MPQSKNTKGPLLFLGLALLLGGITWFGLRALQNAKPEEAQNAAGGGGQPPTPVVVTPVELVPSQRTHRVVGSLRAKNRAEVAAREDGAVTEVLVDEGDVVHQHDILARLDPQRLEAQIAQAQATLTAARSMISQREAERSRTDTDLIVKRKLFEQQAISESELLDAEREAKVANSREKSSRDSLTAAAAALKLLEVRKNDLVIRAPFDARVVARHIEPGEWLRTGDPAFTLVSNGTIEAWLQVPERYSSTVGSRDIKVTIGENTFSATNLRPVPEADVSSRVMTVIADIEDPKAQLVPGLSVTADLPVSDDSPRLSVPADAIVTTYAGSAVYRSTPSPDGGPPFAERIPVAILFQRNGNVFVDSKSLSKGDLVVVEGNERLFPQTPLAPTNRTIADTSPAN